MDSHVELRGIRSLKFTLLAGLTLLTTDALFAQGAGQSDLDELKARMDQMQKQYEQRIEKMDLRPQKDGTDLLTPSMPSC